MFNDFDTNSEDDSLSIQPTKKKKEEHVEMKSEVVHSSLEYHTIKVPPMVEYKNIDSYCERRGEKFLSDAVPSVSSVGCISSPVVLRTPQPSLPDTPSPSSEYLPFCFFSIEELSLVKSLKNWNNVKVCPVGTVDYNTFDMNECYLNSLGESGSWKILLNVSSLEVNPAPHTTLQVYGMLSIQEENPIINVFFVRNLRTADLSLFVESNRLMQKYVPRSIHVRKNV